MKLSNDFKKEILNRNRLSELELVGTNNNVNESSGILSNRNRDIANQKRIETLLGSTKIRDDYEDVLDKNREMNM